MRSDAPLSWHTARAWSRRQWPSSSSSTGSVGEHRRVDRPLVVGQRVAGRHGEHEVLREQLLDLEVVGGHGEGEDAGVEGAGAELLQHDLGLLLDQQQLEVGEAGVDLGHHVGEQVRGEGGEQAQAEAARLRVLGLPGDGRDRLGLARA